MKIRLIIFDFWKTLAYFPTGNSVRLYDDAHEALNLPFKKAILTSTSKLLIESSGIQKLAEIFTPEMGVSKPDPRAFLMVLEKLEVKPEQAVMIGDSIERDLMPAENLGIIPILIDRENKSQNYPGIKINSLKELKDVLAGL